MGVVQETLPVVVGLGNLEEGTNKLVINLISNTRHENERRDNTLGTSSLESSRDLSVPDSSGGSQDGTSRLVGHCKQNGVVELENVIVNYEVVRVSISEVFSVSYNFVSAGEGVVSRLADRGWNTGGQVEGELGVASSHTVGTSTTLAVLGATRCVFRTLVRGRAGYCVGDDSRGSHPKKEDG